jgi:hypothetical protein
MVHRVKAWSPLAASAFLVAGFTANPAAAESRSYVVSWFTTAVYSEEGDCDGINPSIDGIYRTALINMGFKGAELEAMFKKYVGSTGGEEADEIIVNRARINGKPVNAYANPAAAPDPHLYTVKGKHGFGFDLDGKGPDQESAFEDPYTHEKGLDNQWVRAMGCHKSMRGFPPADRPLQGGAYQWDSIRNSMPAWLVTISGADLAKGGDVTVTFERALEHVALNAKAETQPDTTFRIDPDPRWHSVFKATLKDGVIETREPGYFHLLSDPYYVPEFRIKDARFRIKLTEEGGLDGILGGYQPWLDLYWSMANGGLALECCVGVDFVGMYHTLKRLADADPDPATGRNTAISIAYRIEAVRAFTVPAPAPATQASAR